jgi:single-stranded-DNA-specific exonuclease
MHAQGGTLGRTSAEAPEGILLPQKTISVRPLNTLIYEAYLAAGFPGYICQFLGRRLDRVIPRQDLLSPKVNQIADPINIPTVQAAIDRIVKAITGNERIALVCDHDMDGTASAALLWTALVKLFSVRPEAVSVFTSHRLSEGYGISDPVVERILAFHPHLVITADQGSSDEPRISSLKSNAIDVIVTDHHAIPASGPPQSALAVVNPAREDANYDHHVCGAGVAFLLMAKVKTALVKDGWMANDRRITDLLDFVAVATIADCVSLSPCSSHANRAFIKRGLAQINTLHRPCWRVFAQDRQRVIHVEAVSFALAPAIAAAGRLGWADVGFRFLIADTDAEARSCWDELKRQNEERKDIERELCVHAFAEAASSSDSAIVLLLENGHAGVHGITASRVVEAFGKPCAIFCAKTEDTESTDPPLARGSFRSIPGLNIREALEDVNAASPDLLVTFGGHVGAAGATIRTSEFERFKREFIKAVCARSAASAHPGPVILTDGELDIQDHNLDAVKNLAALGPFGRGFDPPTFSGTFVISSIAMLSNGKHARLLLRRDDLTLPAVWFNLNRDFREMFAPGNQIGITYRLQENEFRGSSTLQAIVLAGEPA